MAFVSSRPRSRQPRSSASYPFELWDGPNDLRHVLSPDLTFLCMHEKKKREEPDERGLLVSERGSSEATAAEPTNELLTFLQLLFQKP